MKRIAKTLHNDGTYPSGSTPVVVDGVVYVLFGHVQGPDEDVEVELVPTAGIGYHCFLPCPPDGTTAVVVDTYTDVARKPHQYDNHVTLPPLRCTVVNGEWRDVYGKSRGRGPRPQATHRNYE